VARKKKKKGATEDGALALIEKGFNLLKDTPFTTHACYLIGTLPFCLAFIYFWMDMSRSPFAGNHQVLASAGLAGLFFWMKIWQAMFVKQLTLHVRMEAPPPLSAKDRWFFGLRQAILQASGLIIIPLSLCLILPFCWVYAFYQNCLYYGADSAASTGSIIRQSARKAALWPVQNHVIIWLINPLLLFLVSVVILVYIPNIQDAADSLFYLTLYIIFLLVLCTLMSPLTVVVALNLLAFILLIPYLIRTLLGIENAASQNMDAMFNSSTLVLLCCLVYLVMDPLIKATYVLRCFYGDSILSGMDIRASLIRLKKQGRTLAFILGCLAIFHFSSEPAEAAVSGTGNPEQLQQNIEEELEKPLYSWRLPRDRKQTTDSGIASTLDKKIEKALERIGKKLEVLAERIVDWLGFRTRVKGQRNQLPIAWGAILKMLAWCAACILVIAVIILIIKHFRVPPPDLQDNDGSYLNTPDLEDENISADDLPVDEWTALALEMLRKGETRLAVRALFLSGLAFLGDQRLLQIRRFKSNREYLRELKRRSHVHGELAQAFSWSVDEFEGIWYGEHEADSALFEAFQTNLSTMKQEVS
jgi:hypothetical protein